MGKLHIHGLNVLRFTAAFAVMIYHYTLGLHDNLPPLLRNIAHNLPIGVDLFFLISGFLIIYLLIIEKETTNKISLWKFYTRRSLRIFPLYYAIVGIAYLFFQPHDAFINFTAFNFFAGNFWMISVDRWTISTLNPLWSISIEEHFYLVIPLLIYIIPVKKLTWLFFSVILISVGYRLFASSTFEYYWMRIYMHTASRCDVLAIGGLLAYLYRYNTTWLKKINPSVVWISCFVVLACMALLDFSDFSKYFNVLFKKYLYIIPLAVAFIGFINDTSDPIFKFFKNQRLLNYLGKISFGIYMFHSPVLLFIERIWLSGPMRVGYILSAIGLTCLLAAFSFECFEKQILRLKRFVSVIETNHS